MDKTCPLKNNAKCDKTCAWYVDELPAHDFFDSEKYRGCSLSVMNYQIYELTSVFEKIDDMIRDEVIFSLDNISNRINELVKK